MSQSVVTTRQPQQLSCSCAFYRPARVHHDRLLTVENDLDALIDLFDLAVTWGELDYSGQRLVEPVAWSEFASSHRWQNVNRVQQIFQLATDVALRSQTVSAPLACAERSGAQSGSLWCLRWLLVGAHRQPVPRVDGRHRHQQNGRSLDR
jgi:hypothetical protein